MNRYGSNKCATKLDACPRDGKTYRNRHNIIRSTQRQTKRHKGNLCDISMWHQDTENRDSQNKTYCRSKSYRLSRRSQHANIRLNHHETTYQQHHIRHKIKIHVHVRKIVPEQLDGYIIIHHNIDIHNPTRSFYKYNIRTNLTMDTSSYA